MHSITLVRDPAALKAALALERGRRIALTPTMGALHEGHLSLLHLARERAGFVIASIFVNPTQFAPNEDFASYPRDEASDLISLANAGCDLVYAPSAEAMYPEGFSTRIILSGISEPLEGALRPGHFAGVATVVAKLLIQVAPDVAVFGEKDYQQLQVIRRLVRDLDLPAEIVGAPIKRDPDGLALSSRNVYLTPAERRIAPMLHAELEQAAEQLRRGAPAEMIGIEPTQRLKSSGFAVDYFEVRAADDLAPLEPGPVNRQARLLAAARLGRTRLIDNVEITRHPVREAV